MQKLKTLYQAFEEQVVARPDAVAIDSTYRTFTYQHLNQRVNELAALLVEAGVAADMPIAFCMPRSPEMLITILAILKAGGAYLPLDPSQPEERLLLLLKDSNAPLLILTDSLEMALTSYSGHRVIFPSSSTRHTCFFPKNKIPYSRMASEGEDTSNLAYIIYTSGSTGNPKGVLIEQQSVLNYAYWFEEYANISSLARIDCSSHIIFDMAVTTSIVPLMLGKTLVLCDDEIKSNSKHYLQYLAAECIELIKITPSYFQLLLHEVQNAASPPLLPDLKAIILGGENLSTVLCESWLKHYPHHNLYNEYGPTEATVAVSAYHITPHNVMTLGTSVPIGTPCPNVSFHLIAEDGQTLDDTSGTVGELAISGICLARGYMGQEEMTRKQFISTPSEPFTRRYKTGDLCRQLQDGNWLYLGRKDKQVKVRGFRVEPTEIEACIKRHPAIQDAVVLLQEDGVHEKRLVAYYICRQIQKGSPKGPTSHEIRLYLQTHLADYMIPSLFIPLEAFPLTANGKLDIHGFPQHQLHNAQEQIQAFSPLEQALATIWSEELGINGIGLDDHFFELGGHSLSAARIVSRISQELSKDIALKDFYTASTIASLALLIQKAENTADKPKIAEAHLLQKQETFPLSDFQLMLWLALTFEPKARYLNIVAHKSIQGPLDHDALLFAFRTVLKQHPILTHRILKFRPEQTLQKKYRFILKQVDLTQLTIAAQEKTLKKSMHSLSNFKQWSGRFPLLRATLFQLATNQHEIQICMPHIIADDVSPEILFASLSKFYDAYKTPPKDAAIDWETVVERENAMHQQTLKESLHWDRHLDKNIQFWQEYLSNVDLFEFPEAFVVPNMDRKKQPYSTYVEIPRATLSKFQAFCTKMHVSLNNGICAVLAKVLTPLSARKTAQTILMNLVKSTRDHPEYDHALGCFLRLEPIKVTVDNHTSLTTLMRLVHQSAMDTHPYQRCPGLIKLASIPTFRRRKKWIYSVIDVFLSIYTYLFRIQNPLRKIIKLSSRLSSRGLRNHFLISLNMHSNFVASPISKRPARNGKLVFAPASLSREDLLQVHNYFDVCLIYDEAKSTPYIVISSNLQPSFRQSLAEAMIDVMDGVQEEIASSDT